jgi:hypothetical protein
MKRRSRAMSGVNFVSMGHTAEVLAWRITVKDGVATLDGEAAGAYADPGNDPVNQPWRCEYTAAELRDLAALFTGAAELLARQQVAPTGEGLSLTELERLPVGASVRDRDGDAWHKVSGDGWSLNSGSARESTAFMWGYAPLTLVSMGSVQG